MTDKRHKCGPAYSCQSCHRLHCFECDAHMPGATEYKTIANRFCKSDACAIAKQAFRYGADTLSDDVLLTIVRTGITTKRTAISIANELLERRHGDGPDDPEVGVGSRLRKLETNMVLAQGVGAFFGEFLGRFLRPTEPKPWFHMGTSDEHVPPRSAE